METVGRMLLAALALYAAYLTIVFFVQRDLLFPGAGFPREDWAARAGVELWQRTYDGVVTEALYLRHPDTGAPRPLVVLFHGNGDYAEGMLSSASMYVRMGCHVLIPEYRGYNRVPGEPTEAALTADSVRLVEEATNLPEVDGGRVVFHGVSLGGGVAAAVARERAPQALILQSTFTSVRGMAARFNAPAFLVLDPFDTLTFVKGAELPVLVVHGRTDEVVPFAMGQELAASAGGARFEVFDGGHGIPAPADQPRFWRVVGEFVESAGVAGPVAAVQNL